MNRLKHDKCVFGFIRHFYFLPFYFQKIIQSYYLEEWLYLLNENNKKHNKLSTLQIV